MLLDAFSTRSIDSIVSLQRKTSEFRNYKIHRLVSDLRVVLVTGVWLATFRIDWAKVPERTSMTSCAPKARRTYFKTLKVHNNSECSVFSIWEIKCRFAAHKAIFLFARVSYKRNNKFGHILSYTYWLINYYAQSLSVSTYSRTNFLCFEYFSVHSSRSPTWGVTQAVSNGRLWLSSFCEHNGNKFSLPIVWESVSLTRCV